MIHEAIGTGATVEEARLAALAELKAPEDRDTQFEVLEMPVKKTFGLFGGSPAKVRAYYEESPALVAFSYLKNMLEKMDIGEIQTSMEEVENGINIKIETENYGLVIGHRGETLNSLQFLTGLAANRVTDDFFKVTINIGNYREKRESMLSSLAKRTAIQVTRSGKPVTLEPMNPYERRIVHTAVQGIIGATSHSTGLDADRRVIIAIEKDFKPTGTRPYRPSGNRPYNKTGYNKGGYKGGYKGNSDSTGGYNKTPGSFNKPASGGYKGNSNNTGGYNKAPGSFNKPASGGYKGNSNNTGGYKSNYNRPNTNTNPNAKLATPATASAADTSKPTREPKSDSASAPMYGRIDK